MPEVTVKVTIPEGWELACDRMRPAKTGEHYLYEPNSCVIQAARNELLPRVILRPAFQWPSWLKAAAIARDSNGIWYAYEKVPTLGNGFWDSQNLGKSLPSWLLDIDLPSDGIPWQETLRVNPACLAEAKSCEG